MRVRSIDALRGMAIVGMVFFTILCRLAATPDILSHNVPGTAHIGDFVLPLFLFASGMSLFFFREKRKNKKKLDYALDIVERFGKLALISFFITPFSAGGFLRMDEVMLSAVLFIPCVLLAAMPEMAAVAASLLAFAAYFILQNLHALPDFSADYLGGYAAALFWLPVMLGGLMAGGRVGGKKELTALVAGWVVMTVVLLALAPVDKMAASPSFMALSVFVSLGIYVAVEALMEKTASAAFWEPVEYLGRDPFRYWVLMFVLVVAPISIYSEASGGRLPLGLPWVEAVFFSLACVPLLYIVSKLLDRISIICRRSPLQRIS